MRHEDITTLYHGHHVSHIQERKVGLPIVSPTRVLFFHPKEVVAYFKDSDWVKKDYDLSR